MVVHECMVFMNTIILLYTVGSELQIKIADFGLARKLNAKNYFEIEGNGVLPIRTMAPECFLTGHFTPASDVWYKLYFHAIM